LIPADVKEINVRIENARLGKVWFDDVKIVKGNTSQTVIVEESNYYPFGLQHKGYNNVVSSNGNSTAQKIKFGGKEYQDELGLEWYDVSARNYDPALGRWMNLDPLADKMRNNSPYNYAFNNPVLFEDPDGMFPIIIHVRSFAPFKNFGPGMAWSGDNRGFSTNPNAKSRLHQISNYETDTGISSHQARGAFSSSSYGAWAYSDGYYKDYSSRGNINTHMYGNNDAVFPAGTFGPRNIIPFDGGPTWDIDVHTNLDINVSDIDGGNQLLSISGQISGDEFPNAEAYVSDANGNSVFLGVFVTQSGPQEGPTMTLFGDKNNPMMNINMGIETDKNGIFTGVRVGDKTISIDEWNKNSSGPMSVDEFKKKHGDYYNQLFGDK